MKLTMKCMNWSKIVLSIFVPLLTGIQASAAPTTVGEARHQLQQTVLAIAKGYDPQAVVTVKIELKQMNQDLPSTPFVFQNLTIQAEDGSPAWKRVEVTIFANKDRFPGEVINLIKNSIQASGFDNAEFKLEELPKVAPDTKSLGDLTPSATFISGANTSSFIPLLAGFAAVAFALLLVIVAMMRATLQKITSALETGFNGMGQAISTSGTGERESIQQDKGQSNHHSGSASAAGAGITTQEYPFETYFACFADCYWSGQDDYAAFLWRRMKTETKKQILDRGPHFKEYARYLSGIEGMDLAAIDEPYYLNPFPIENMDATALTAVVKKYPKLASMLPQIRVESLDFTAAERVKFMSKNTGTAPSPEAFKAVQSSPRMIPSHQTIRIRSIDEEREILAIADLSLDQIAEIPSLGWLLRLPKDDRETVFKNFSARDLASAWIGPKEVLEELAHDLPEKKRKMVESYLNQRPGNRDEEAFRSVHREGIRLLRQKAVDTGSGAKAA